MNIAYHLPTLNTIYAQRTIYFGYKHAFEDLGHYFHTYTSGDDLEDFIENNEIDIFITASHFYYRKYLDYKSIKNYRNSGMVLCTKIDFWKSPLSRSRISEAKSLKDDNETIRLIKEGLLGDVFFHVVEQGDERMEGFEEETGYKYFTIPLAADKLVLINEFNPVFSSDISFIGTYLPSKRSFFNDCVFPLRNLYELKLYGQDWTFNDRMIGWIQKFGQYFNISKLSSIRKPSLHIEDESKIYASSNISINVHEEYQKKFGGDCNERTFKIPISGGFEITDDVACIHKYFNVGREIIVAENQKDWFDKVDFYMKNPDDRVPIIEAGKERVLRDHTYQNRVQQLIKICEG